MRRSGENSKDAPRTKLLSNGRYHVMVTDAGGTYSRWKNNAVTRWREDSTCDNWGSFVYIRDVSSGRVWSSTLQPTLDRTVEYRADFSGDLAVLRSHGHGIDTRVEVCVDQESDVELRRVTVTNYSDVFRNIDLCSYAEIVLSSPMDDDAHPAFNKLFVQTEIMAPLNAILCHRRSSGDKPESPWMFHMLVGAGSLVQAVSYETDRLIFIGRGNSSMNPQALGTEAPLSGSQGSVLDPVAAIRLSVALDPGASTTLTYVSGVAETRALCLALMKKCAETTLIDVSFNDAMSKQRLRLQNLGATSADLCRYSLLADAILYGNAAFRADSAVILHNRQGQPGLWRYSISGDLPIVLLQIGVPPQWDLVAHMLRAQAWWRSSGLEVDLVVCGSGTVAQRQGLQDQVVKFVVDAGHSDRLDQPGGIYVRLAVELPDDDRLLLQAAARVMLDDSNGTLQEQMDQRLGPDATVNALNPVPRQDAGFGQFESQPALIQSSCEPGGSVVYSGLAAAPRDCSALLYNNGRGGFTSDRSEYVVTLASGQTTPAPWVNVLANPLFGSIVSESGCANSWSENAHEFRLTPWSNDPVGDSTGEAFYVRDEDSGYFWSPTAWPCRGRGDYVCRHGFGYSTFTHTEEGEGVQSELTIYVARDASIKFAALKILNTSGRQRRLSATGYIEWVMGEHRAKNMMHVTTQVDAASGAILAHNAYSSEFGDRTAFFHVNDAVHSKTADRVEFIGQNGTLTRPAAMIQARLSGRVGAALDPCAAIRVPFVLAHGQTHEIIFKLGASSCDDEARALISRFNEASSRAALDEITRYWTRTLSAVRIETPDPSLDLLANGWLVYQTLACRMWGRSAFYQPGGAFGFRDQLQDAMALVHTEPGLVRAHILLCASRQFPEGDVQHWWHPPVGRGVRTRCSDDYLWLVLATCRYVQSTGDNGILNEYVHFLQGRLLEPGEVSYYELPGVAGETATLYEHCLRAVRRGLNFGVHGLPLMGSGDWNDGMNNVGAQGKGESVWLAFFLYEVLRQFSPIAGDRGDTDFADLCRTESGRLSNSIEQYGWDGAWFRRAYFDDGQPLGSAQNKECQIDSIAQSWSVLSGAAQPEHQRQAMDAVDRLLVEHGDAIIKLLAPPFDRQGPDAGYIEGYVPGVRENGGQYTHAAIWAAMAFAAIQDHERAWGLLAIINPVNHALCPEALDTYKVEPYVVASDVYALAPHTGRGGWTWYSGSAGWLYQLIIESVLGLRRQANTLYIEPCIPAHWTSFNLSYRFGCSTYRITVTRQGSGCDKTKVVIDGVVQSSPAIELADNHRDVDVTVYI